MAKKKKITQRKKSSPFKFVKVMDQGTTNPIVNRLTLQFLEILSTNFILLPETEIEKTKNYLWGCMNDLLKAEESKNAYLKTEMDAINEIIEQHKESDDPTISGYNDPSHILQKHFENFLLTCVIAIRKVVNIGKIVLPDQCISSPKDFLKVFSKTSNERRMLEKDSIWVKELYDLRREAEHNLLRLTKFDANRTPDGRIFFKLICLPDSNKPVRGYIQATLENCFSFCEDMTAILLNTKCHDMVRIVALPKEQQSKRRNFRYVLSHE